MSDDADGEREWPWGWIIPVVVGVATGVLLGLTDIAEKDWPSWVIVAVVAVLAVVLVRRLLAQRRL